MGSRAVLIAWSASLVLKSFSILLALPYLRDRLLKRVLAGVGLAAALCLPYFAFRPEDFWEFVKLNLSPSSMIYKGAFGFQAFLRGLVWHMPSAWTAPSFEVLGWKLDLEGIVLIIFSVAFLILSVRATVNFHNRPGRRALDLLLWTTLFLLVFKSVWEYHYVMILPALTAAYLVTGSRVVLVLGALLGLPTLFAASTILAGVDSMAPLEEWPGWFRVLHFGVKSLPTLGLFIWCLLRGANPYRSPRRV